MNHFRFLAIYEDNDTSKTASWFVKKIKLVTHNEMCNGVGSVWPHFRLSAENYKCTGKINYFFRFEWMDYCRGLQFPDWGLGSKIGYK